MVEGQGVSSPRVLIKRAAAAAEVLSKLLRLKAANPRVVSAFLFLSLACFFFCFLYVDYGLEPLGKGGFGGFFSLRLGSKSLMEMEVEEGKCDIFEGKWVWDDEYPLYEAEDCSFLDEGFRCKENGRHDSFYTKWRWQPAHCNLPRFNGKMMLEGLRNRRLAFVGDSIGRNQWESLLCMLSSSVTDKKSIYEVNGSPITKHNGFLIFKFEEYNCTIEYYRAPFLVVQGRAPAGVPKKVKTVLKLDILDWSSRVWRNADVLVFNTGHWWNYQKTLRSGCYFQIGDELKLEMSVEQAYQKSLETLLTWIKTEVDPTKTRVVFRTYAPVHFRGGDWRTGGSCRVESLPNFEASGQSLDAWAFHAANGVISDGVEEKSVPQLTFLNITELTFSRRDGHPSLYYLGPKVKAPLHREDCSHWCLPGVPDMWNELLYALLLRWRFSVTSR